MKCGLLDRCESRESDIDLRVQGKDEEEEASRLIKGECCKISRSRVRKSASLGYAGGRFNCEVAPYYCAIVGTVGDGNNSM